MEKMERKWGAKIAPYLSIIVQIRIEAHQSPANLLFLLSSSHPLGRSACLYWARGKEAMVSSGIPILPHSCRCIFVYLYQYVHTLINKYVYMYICVCVFKCVFHCTAMRWSSMRSEQVLRGRKNEWGARPVPYSLSRPGTPRTLYGQVLVSIQSLILVPNPYFNEPGVYSWIACMNKKCKSELTFLFAICIEKSWPCFLTHVHGALGFEKSMNSELGRAASEAYTREIRKHCVRVAMLGQLQDPPPLFRDIVMSHCRLRCDHILKVSISFHTHSLSLSLGLLERKCSCITMRCFACVQGRLIRLCFINFISSLKMLAIVIFATYS